jgi:prenylcysteine oxidase/farnesylcysteine lyase
LNIAIDVYEAGLSVGGRSTVVYPYGSKSLEPVELGASIFVAANKNMMRASKEFNLTVVELNDDDEDTGVWDGRRFIVKACASDLQQIFQTHRISYERLHS